MNINRMPQKEQTQTSSAPRVIFSVDALHYDSTGRKTKMQLMVTKSQVYLQKNSTVMRQFCLIDIDAITLSNSSSELVIHLVEEEDERLDLKDSRRIFVRTLLYMLTYRVKWDDKGERGFSVYSVDDQNLDLYVTGSEDIEEGHRVRPESKYCQVMDYKKYIEEEKTSLNRTPQLLYNNDNLSKTVKKLSIHDFELLKVLGKGAHGKVLLAKLKDTDQLQALKIIRKQHIIESKQLEHTISEKQVLTTLQHPFIVSLTHCFHTEHKVYFVMEFMKGGELFQHLRSLKQFSEEQTKFIAACIILALGHLHDNDFIYRDLKPENVLLDEHGYCKLTDFGLSKSVNVNDLAKTFCGTPEYMSPEVIMDKGSNRPGDWWSLGVLIYEMIFGIPPFYSTNIQKMYKNTLLNPLKFKKHTQCSEQAKDFIAGLLTKEPRKRLGSVADINELIAHPWFKDFDWQALREKRLEAPYKPFNCGNNWERHFDPEFMKMKARDSVCTTSKAVTGQFEDRFAEFDYVDPGFANDTCKSSGYELLSTKASEIEENKSCIEIRNENDSFIRSVMNKGEKENIRIEGVKKNMSQGNESKRICIDI